MDQNESSAATPTVPADTPVGFSRPKPKQIVIAVAVTLGVLLVVFGWILPGIVPYEYIWEAITGMEPVAFVVLLLIWAARIPCDGLVYARSLPGLKVNQGSASWSASTAFANIVPGPGDLLVRLSMYRTWGHQVDQSMISMTTSGIFQNANRLTLPVIGVVWYAADSGAGDDGVSGWLIVLAAIGVAILVGGFLFVTAMIRSESFALRVGGWLQRLVSWGAERIERDAPDDIADRLIGWRDSAKDLIRERWWQMWLAHFSTTVLSVALLVASLRFAGVEDDQLGLSAIFLAYALVQLVTLIPITNGNIGIAEVAYILFLDALAVGGDEVTGAIAAGVIVFRLYTWLLVIPVGFVATAIWRNRWKKRLGYDPFTILVRDS